MHRPVVAVEVLEYEVNMMKKKKTQEMMMMIKMIYLVVEHMEVVSTARPLEAIVTKPGSHRAVDDHCQCVHLDVTYDDDGDDDDS